MKISTKIHALVLIGVFITGATITGLSAYFIHRQGQQEVKRFETAMMNQRKMTLQSLVQNAYIVLDQKYKDAHDPEKLIPIYENRLKNLIDVAFGVLESTMERADLSLDQKKSLALKTIRQLRYDGNDYFWINDLTPKMIMHPFKPELDGKNLTDFEDPDGKNLFVEMVKVCKAFGEGYVDYKWPKPGSDKPVPKISYVKLFEPLGWIIGTGVYLEVAEKDLKKNAKNIINTLRYGKNNNDYFYIFDIETKKMIQHPEENLIGKKIGDPVFTDSQKKTFMIEQYHQATKKGKGYTRYMWPKLGKEQPVPKLTYVRLFREWGWVVATGMYLDDIENIVLKKSEDVSKAVYSQVFRLSVVVLIIMGLILV